MYANQLLNEQRPEFTKYQLGKNRKTPKIIPELSTDRNRPNKNVYNLRVAEKASGRCW